jgi:parallel beta-helix repeat protein
MDKMNHLILLSIFLGASSISLAAQVNNPNLSSCSMDKIKAMTEPATPAKPKIFLDCNLKLKPNDIVTKQIVISGSKNSGLTIDCDGATLKANTTLKKNNDFDPRIRLLVSSKQIKNAQGEIKWDPIEHVVVKNCVIEGSIHIRGKGAIAGNEVYLDSSRKKDHTERVQKSSPRGIILKNNRIIGMGNLIPIYIGPGVTHSSILDSYIGGSADKSAIYLEAESAFNTIQGNTIETNSDGKMITKEREEGVETSTKFREIIAVDGSAYNTIKNNKFNNLSHGGIFLYRNCGEDGVIRHQSPSNNIISNNTFKYKNDKDPLPTIWIASRNGGRDYCDIEKGYNVGSSKSNLDHAKHNVVKNNKIFHSTPKKMIRDDSGLSNEIGGNEFFKTR